MMVETRGAIGGEERGRGSEGVSEGEKLLSE
jgi:hypothetical protein